MDLALAGLESPESGSVFEEASQRGLFYGKDRSYWGYDSRGDAMTIAGRPTTTAKLTIIITTSLTPSAPSTELISSVLESYVAHCPELLGCNVIVVFDGYDKVVEKAQLKKGRVTSEQATAFDLYKENVKKFILDRHYADGDVSLSQTEAEAEYGGAFHRFGVPYTVTQTHDKRVSFIEAKWRLGFGLAVRSALRITETPYVWIQQHDWVLAYDFPLEPLLEIMEASETKAAPIKYVCLPGIRMGSYATSNDVQPFPALNALTRSLKGDYTSDSAAHQGVKVPLTPLFFWHDKPHVASTAHYLERVFPSRLAMLRGDFIEDKIGQRARAQMKEGLVSPPLFLCRGS